MIKFLLFLVVAAAIVFFLRALMRSRGGPRQD